MPVSGSPRNSKQTHILLDILHYLKRGSDDSRIDSPLGIPASPDGQRISITAKGHEVKISSDIRQFVQSSMKQCNTEQLQNYYA
jgi:hypothetical protein